MRLASVLGFVASLLLGAPVLAAPANPELIAREIGVGAEAPTAPLRISRMDLKVRIAGGMAETTATITFANPGPDEVEGDFTMDLPKGSVVTGYALDIEGQLVDGVLVGERQAKLAYEAKVREGIDPGIATVTRSGAFKSRVYPVLPGKGRTIRLTFVTPIRVDAAYVLPLEAQESVGLLTLKVESDGAASSNVTVPKGVNTRTLEAVVGTWEVAGEATSVQLSGTLIIKSTPDQAGLTLMKHRSGETFFDLEDAAPAGAGSAAPKRLRVYWDRSLSRRDDDLKAELALLDSYLKAAKPASIELVLFDADKPVSRAFTGPDAAAPLLATLETVDYGGASALTGLFERGGDADVCLLFSDGVMSVDAYAARRVTCTLFTVTSAPDADRALLSALAAASDGAFVDLASGSPAGKLNQLLSTAPRVIAVSGDGGKAVEFRALPAGPGRFRIVGPAPASGRLTVRLAGGETRTYSADPAAAATHDGPGAAWAAGRVGELGATDRPDREALIAFVRRYQVATPIAAFVVLEEIDDYAEAGIEPPASLGKDALAEYRELRAEREKELREEREYRIDDVLEMWDARKTWWNTRFAPGRARARGKGGPLARLQAPAPAASDAAAAPPPPPPPPPPPAGAGTALHEEETEVEAVMLTAQRRGGGGGNGVEQLIVTASRVPTTASGRTIAVEIAPWDPDRPYLKALKAAPADQFDAVFREQEKAHGDTPAFYLDVAEFLFRSGRVEAARSMAATAMELPTADTTTLTILADRLARYGDMDRAIWAYERILDLEPDRPQPRRNLAIALVDRAEGEGVSLARAKADYARALDLLTEVVMTPWDGDYDGVEVIALMEANRVISKLRDAGETRFPLDRRLIALLDVDVRIVMEWNTAGTDMDLWVDEPTGERVIYSNPDSAAGGLLSNDMTDGYGPEEYVIRRAPRGTYEIRANVYSGDELNPNGPVTIRVKVYRAWGRADEEVEIIDLELKPEQEGEVLLGSVKVGRRPD